MPTSDHFEFHEEDHTYVWTGDGVVLPSVTTIIKEVVQPFAGYQVDPEWLRWRGQLGTAVHKAVELDCQGKLDESTVSGPIKGYFDAWRQARSDLGIFPKTTERIVGSRRLGFAGRLDLEASLRHCFIESKAVGIDAIIDVKTSNKAWDHFGIQLALYDLADSDGNPACAEGEFFPPDPMDGGEGPVGIWYRWHQDRHRAVLLLRENSKYKLELFDGPEWVIKAMETLWEYHEQRGGWDGLG
jgi:hypothetical protein